MNKPRIAILINAFWNSGAGISGGDQRVIQIFNRLSDKLIIDIYTSVDGKKAVADKITGANCIISPESLNRGNLLSMYRKRTAWAKQEIVKKRYDLVYASSDFLPDVVPAAHYLKKYLKTIWLQCIFHLYPKWWQRPGSKVKNLIGQKAQQLSLRIIKKSASGVIVINSDVRRYLVAKGFKAERIFLNPCGVDPDFLNGLQVTKKPLQAVFLARLSESKGIFDLPPIWKEVVSRIPQAKLLIIGGGSPENAGKLKEDIARLALTKNIKVLGFLPDAEVYSQIKSSQLFVFPSYEEGFGMVIAEAMACGLPAVAWDLPVYREVFPKGLVQVPLGEIDQMAEVIIRLLSDQNQAGQIAKEGWEWVKRYGWSGIANAELEVMEALLKSEAVK